MGSLASAGSLATIQCPGCKGNRLVACGPGPNQGVPVTCDLCGGSGRYEPAYVPQPRWYTFGNPSGAGGGATITLTGGNPGPSLAASITIDQQADFQPVWYIANSTGSFQAQLFDSSSRPWQPNNVFIASVNMWGTAQNPFPVMIPLIIPAQGIITGLFQDTANAGNNVVQACLVGFDLYQ